MSGTTSSPAHLHGNVTVSRSSSVCLQAKQEYLRCNSHTCSPCSETPGYTQNFSPYSLLGLFKCVQHYPATYTTPETESHAYETIIAQVDLGFSYRQKTVGEHQQRHFFYHHNKQWRPPGLCCEFTSTVLSVTSDCRPVDSSISKDHLFKYADDKALLGLIIENNHQIYETEVQNLVSLCDSNCLQLNTKKTKEMVIDFRKLQHDPPTLCINGEVVERE